MQGTQAPRPETQHQKPENICAAPQDEPPDPKKLAFDEYALLDCLGDAHPPRGRSTIGLALWNCVPTGRNAYVPSDFVAEHRQGSDGILSVWNRHGIAVAYTTQGAETAANLRSLVALMNEFLVCQYRPQAIILYDRIVLALDNPSGRLLRKLFETSSMGRIHQKHYEWELLQSQNRIAAETQHVANAQVKLQNQQVHLQTNLDFVEVFIVAFYSFELMEILVRPLGEAGKPGCYASWPSSFRPPWELWFTCLPTSSSSSIPARRSCRLLNRKSAAS